MIITSKTIQKYGYTRPALLVKEGTEMEVLEEHMEEDTAAIWFKVNRKGFKKIVIGAIYREHQLLCQDRDIDTESESKQTARLKQILRQWESATEGCEAVIIGDINLDQMKWNNPELINKKIVEAVQDRIETRGFIQIVEGYLWIVDVLVC